MAFVAPDNDKNLLDSGPLSAFAGSVLTTSPMLFVPDLRATMQWYQAVGFRLESTFEDGGELIFARLTLGRTAVSLSRGPVPGPKGLSLWFFSDRVGAMYDALKNNAELSVQFDEDLHAPFYGGHQFSIKDINGVTLVFFQPEWMGWDDNRK